MPFKLYTFFYIKIIGKLFLVWWNRKHELWYNCDLKYSPSDGHSVTWHEPAPARTTSNPVEKLSPGIVQVYEGSSVTLNWSYTLTSSLRLGVINFNTDGIVTINADGSAEPVAAQFQERFNVSSTTGKTSLFISPVTVGDDKAYGEFRCELIDSIPKTWKRAILLEVIGKFKSVADYKKGVP